MQASTWVGTGVGVLYGKEALLEKLPPSVFGGGIFAVLSGYSFFGYTPSKPFIKKFKRKDESRLCGNRFSVGAESAFVI